MKILIDGYNLIFECGWQGRRVNGASLARARGRLLAVINSAFSVSERAEIVIVYDAAKIPLSGQQVEETIDGVIVMYSIEFDDADTMIENLIAKHSAPKNLLVVSSDHRLQKAALRRRAQTIDSGDWFDQIEHRKPGGQSEIAVDPKTQPTGELFSEAELDAFRADIDEQMGRDKGKR